MRWVVVLTLTGASALLALFAVLTALKVGQVSRLIPPALPGVQQR